MANKKFLMAILVMTLVFGMALVGCGSGTEEEDTWTDVTSLSQLNGTWKGPLTGEAEYGGGITMKFVGEYTYTIDAGAETLSISAKGTWTFSGSNIDSRWPDIKADAIENGLTVNDSDHSTTGTQTTPNPIPVTLTIFSGWQINQNGKKVRIPAGEDKYNIFRKQ
jgi:hypothetical protein